ncbi:MAG: T9SS type A sorting domain-containing protein, partial [Bacteroidales bacterium]|nr:T9SS type A sorting domain-containing protein [Bacteroidales bacterium]
PKADIFIAKYNETGYHQWSVQTTGYSHDYSNSIDILGDTILISGRYASLTMNLGDFELMNNSGNDDDDLFVGVLRDTTDIICGESQFSITSTQNFVCDQDSLLLNIVEINSNYIEWFKDHLLVHNGFEASIYVKESGFYYAIINSGSPCVDTTESVWIDKKEKPNIQILPEGELILCQGDNIILHTPNEEENDLSWFYNFTHNISSSDSIDVNKGGHYLLKTDNNFCINTDTVFIESGKPIIDMELEPDSVSCPGKTITVSSFNDISYHYSWTLNGEILSNHLNYLELNDSGWVTLDVSYKECSVKDSVYIQQNVQPQLDSFLESLVVDVLPVQLSVDSGNYNCFWSQHTNGQVISDSYHVEIHEDGYYSLYAYNLCGNVYFPFQIISIPNNLIYPNPTKGCFRILALGDNETKLKLHIFDSKGKNIMESLEVLNNELICTHHLKSGTYYIVVESNQATYTEKLIIYN